jgi:hypothetical protein
MGSCEADLLAISAIEAVAALAASVEATMPMATFTATRQRTKLGSPFRQLIKLIVRPNGIQSRHIAALK